MQLLVLLWKHQEVLQVSLAQAVLMLALLLPQAKPAWR